MVLGKCFIPLKCFQFAINGFAQILSIQFWHLSWRNVCTSNELFVGVIRATWRWCWQSEAVLKLYWTSNIVIAPKYIYILYIECKHPFAYYFIALIHICLAHALNHSILVSCHHLGYTNTHTHLSVVSMPPNSEHIACRETSLLLLLLLLRLLSSSFSIFISVALPENFVKAFLLELFGDRISFRFIYLILCAQSWNRTFLTIFVVWKSEISCRSGALQMIRREECKFTRASAADK